MSTFDGTLESLSAQLLSTGLLKDSELRELLRHASGFPCLPRHRLFFEYRLQPDLLVLEGYGHGYDRWILPSLLESRVDFAAAGPLAAAMARDPFAEDRGRYLDLARDCDPEWIEYDHADGAFADEPGVFFSFPARFRNPLSATHLEKLATMLGALLPEDRSQARPGPTGMCFWGFLAALVNQEQARGRQIGLYRLGLCNGRKPGWVRIIVNGLSRDTLDALGSELFAYFYPDAIGWIVDHLSGGEDAGAMEIAASVTVFGGIVEAIDLELPYFHKIADPRERKAKVAAFCRLLSAHGIVSSSVAELLVRGAVTSVASPDGEVQGQLLLNHFKFGVGGSTSGRIKTYLELLLRTAA